MTTTTALQDAPWWLPAPVRLQWQQVQEPAALACQVRALLDRDAPEPFPLMVPRLAMAELEACFAGTRAERDERLRALWLRHDPATIARTQRVGVPNKLWERLLDRLGTSRAPGRRCWLGNSEKEGVLHQGVSFGCATEWWGLPACPGATYDDRLWAWGAVQEGTGGADGLGALSARLVWRSDGARWLVHPGLQRAIAEDLVARAPSAPLPRLADGPGYLLACIVDAIAELLGSAAYTSRDLAVLWASTLLPLLAPSTAITRAPGSGAAPDALLGGEPDYLQTLAFFMLHPRIQSTIVAIDRLCTLLLIEDHASLQQVLARLGCAGGNALPAPGDSRHRGQHDAQAVCTATFRLIADVGEQALHRRAAARWDSGFGFKLFRKLLREVLAGGAEGFARQWDAAVHGESRDAPASGHDVGVLAQRLREALSTALWFPGRPPYPGGPAVQQLMELTWLRWTDEDFLG